MWSVAFLSDGTIISADSSGKVQFWDSEMGTLLQTSVVSSSAVLSLAVSEVGGWSSSGFVGGGSLHESWIKKKYYTYSCCIMLENQRTGQYVGILITQKLFHKPVEYSHLPWGKVSGHSTP